MPFKKLGEFLKRFSDFAPGREEQERKTLAVLREVFPRGGLSVKIYKKTLVVSASPGLKSEIFLKKDAILEKLRRCLGVAAPENISFRSP